MKGNYYDIAISDLHFAKTGMEAALGEDVGGYNSCAAGCAQAGEKLLKYLFILFSIPFEARLKESHNLNALLRELIKDFPELKKLTTQCRYLNDFYVEARYPGDNFEWTDYKTAKLCYDYAMDIKTGVDDIIKNPANETRLREELLNKYKR